jgi:putative flippase GtrA
MPRGGHRQFIAFVVAGGIAAAANIGSRIVFSPVMGYEIAILLAYLCGMTVAYLLNKTFVFAASGRGIASEYVRFSVGLARLIFPAVGFAWHGETAAHVIGVLVPVVTSYLGHKHFSFAAPADEALQRKPKG